MGAVATAVRVIFVTASVFVALGFVLFVLDESEKGSREQISKLDDAVNAPDPNTRQELVREREHGTAREAIDDVNDALLKPFAPLVDDAQSTWKRRTIPTVLALVLYGFIGLILANFLPKPKTRQHDWREATG